jgi:hypothetical protein
MVDCRDLDGIRDGLDDGGRHARRTRLASESRSSKSVRKTRDIDSPPTQHQPLERLI